jgi:alkylated DNA repair dioxygenase AlkB
VSGAPTIRSVTWFPVGEDSSRNEQVFDYAPGVVDMQDSLFGAGELELRTAQATHRTWLDAHCWVDQVHGWLGGQMELYDRLSRTDLWHRAERPMYGQMVAEPRLSAGLRIRDARTPAIIRRMAADLSRRYGVGMAGIWCNWYRSGEDAVAWHADRIARAHKDPPVAIVSLGSSRRFLLRPKGGGPSRCFTPSGGDLLVMGGACQHHWEHSVPRARLGGPRISVTFRPTAPRSEHQEDWAPGRVVHRPRS